MCRSLLIWFNPSCKFLLLFPGKLESYSEDNCLCLYLQVFSLHFHGTVSEFLVLYEHLRSIWNWFLYKVRDRGLVSVFYMWIFSFLNTVCWRSCLFSSIGFWHLCKKSDVCRYVGIFPELQFCYTDPCVCFCASTMLFLLLWLCNVI
jgi:hypothetical protein